MNASSGRDVTSVTANSERGEHVRINAHFEIASEKNNTLHISNVYDETRHNIRDEVSELSVPEIHFDRQTHTHHTAGKRSFNACNLGPLVKITESFAFSLVHCGRFC